MQSGQDVDLRFAKMKGPFCGRDGLSHSFRRVEALAIYEAHDIEIRPGDRGVLAFTIRLCNGNARLPERRDDPVLTVHVMGAGMELTHRWASNDGSCADGVL